MLGCASQSRSLILAAKSTRPALRYRSDLLERDLSDSILDQRLKPYGLDRSFCLGPRPIVSYSYLIRFLMYQTGSYFAVYNKSYSRKQYLSALYETEIFHAAYVCPNVPSKPHSPLRLFFHTIITDDCKQICTLQTQSVPVLLSIHSCFID